MPEPAVRDEFPRQDSLGELASRFAVSEEAMHWRLYNFGLVDEPPEQPGGYSYLLRDRADPRRLGDAFVVGDAAGLATRDMCEGIGPAVRSGILAARAIMDGAAYDLAGIDAFTSGNTLVKKGLERMFVG